MLHRRLLGLACALVALPLGMPSAQAQQSTLARVAPPRPAAGQVDWKGAMTGLRLSGAGGKVSTGSLDPSVIDRTRVPILLPTDGTLAEARIFSFGDHYTISADVPGAGLSFTGTTALVTLPAKAPLTLPALGAEQLVIQRTIDGQLASFVRYGVLYTVEVRCDAPTDARCRSEKFVRALVARTTAVVMGRAARQAAGMGG